MKILLFTEKDSSNISLGKIADALLEAGHTIEIFAPYTSKSVLRMFDSRIPIQPISALNMATAHSFDAIFASPFGRSFFKQRDVLQVQKFIFSYDFLVHAHIVNGSDLCFSPSLQNTPDLYDAKLVYGKCAVGEPKFDKLASAQKGHASTNRILFIDSGHYPFGTTGRNALASTLLAMCNRCPHHEFMVKPRFLPNDTVFTHRNSEHLYDCLRKMTNGTLPANLNLLQEHRSMAELIEMSDTVVCLLSTAYLEVLAAGKHLLVLDNLPSDDAYAPRHFMFQRLREGMLGTGALVDYRRAVDLLPEGIHPDPQHFSRYIYQTNRAAENIVEIVEYVEREFLRKNKYPATGRFEYHDFRAQLRKLGTQHIDELISNRLENYIKYSALVQFDYFVDMEVNADALLEPLIRLRRHALLKPGDENLLLKSVSDRVSRAIIDNKEALFQNSVDRGIVLKHLFRMKDYTSILASNFVDCGAAHYFKGRVCMLEGDARKAIDCFQAFLALSSTRDYMQELTDDDATRAEACHQLGKAFISLQDTQQAAHYWSECLRLSENNHKSARRMLRSLCSCAT